MEWISDTSREWLRSWISGSFLVTKMFKLLQNFWESLLVKRGNLSLMSDSCKPVLPLLQFLMRHALLVGSHSWCPKKVNFVTHWKFHLKKNWECILFQLMTYVVSVFTCKFLLTLNKSELSEWTELGDFQDSLSSQTTRGEETFITIWIPSDPSVLRNHLFKRP